MSASTQVAEASANHTEIWTEVLVVGSGFAGICTGIKLREAGFNDFIIVERAHEVGGTWRQNRYPGLTVDVPSFTYCFSFEHKFGWSGIWTPQPEVLSYAHHCATKYGLMPHIQFGKTVTEANYDEVENVWVTRFADGSTIRSRYLVSGSGLTSTAHWPEIEGIEKFQGELTHTTEWPDDFDAKGKRVAIIGTGATSIQLAPEIAKDAGQLHVFQRTPIWVGPKPGDTWVFSKRLRAAFKYVPGLHLLVRSIFMGLYSLLFQRLFTNYPQIKPLIRGMEWVNRRHMRTVEDPEVRAALTPTYSMGCKRPSWSNTYYPMFNQENVELVTSPITRITENGIVTADGVERPIDVLICATGQSPFGSKSMPTYPTRGTGGKDLWTFWDENRHQAVRSIAVNGFPNFFLIFGPHSSFAGTIIAMIEVQATNVVTCLKAVRERGANRIEADAEAQRRDFEKNNRLAREGSILYLGNCDQSNTYYIDRHGDTPMARQTNHVAEWWASKRLHKNMSEFNITAHKAPVSPGTNGAGRSRAKAS